MWRSHLRLALRSLRRDKGTAALGGLSLAVAVAACVLIALFVRDELSYDRAVPNADRVSVVATETSFGGEPIAFTSTPYLLAGALVAEAPAVEAATVTYGRGNEVPVLDVGGVAVEGQEVGLLFADSLYFDVFAYPALAGDVGTALDTPDGAVVTASTARRLFGTAAPLGRTLTVARGDTHTVTVRAVVADLPERSSFPFDVVASFAGWRAQNPDVGTGWGSLMYQTYTIRQAGTDPGALQQAYDAVDQLEAWGVEGTFVDVPIRAYRLFEFSNVQDGFGGSLVFVRLFSAVALLVLVLGAVNYVNLATARGARRAKEVGVRKALGASVGGLVGLLSGEYLALVAVATAVAAPVAVVLVRRWLEGFAYHAPFSPLVLAGATATALVLALASVGVQAFRAARRDPVRALRSE